MVPSRFTSADLQAGIIFRKGHLYSSIPVRVLGKIFKHSLVIVSPPTNNEKLNEKSPIFWQIHSFNLSTAVWGENHLLHQ